MAQSQEEVVWKKISIVGDPGVGKTCLYLTFRDGVFPTGDYDSNIDQNFKGFNDELQAVNHVFDVFGAHDVDFLRAKTYRKASIVLVCYAVDNRKSFKNIQKFWMRELKRMAKNIPIYLVATKIDLRTSEAVASKKFVSEEEGLKLAKKIGAEQFTETSAIRGIGVKETFHLATAIAIEKGKEEPKVERHPFLARLKAIFKSD